MGARRDTEPDEIWSQINHYVKWKRARAICTAMAAIRDTFPGEDQAVVETDLRRLRAELHALMRSGIVI